MKYGLSPTRNELIAGLIVVILVSAGLGWFAIEGIIYLISHVDLMVGWK